MMLRQLVLPSDDRALIAEARLFLAQHGVLIVRVRYVNMPPHAILVYSGGPEVAYIENEFVVVNE